MERYRSSDLDALLHPSQVFGHPSEVVSDPDLTLNEKRAILASWASDACAIEAVPTLRRLPGGKRPCTSMRSWMRCECSTKRRDGAARPRMGRCRNGRGKSQAGTPTRDAIIR
jgi:hypothetical protein